jgi:hypothetical protein
VIRSRADGATLTVRVQPRASRTAITGVYGEGEEQAVKVALMAPPVEGRANEALTEFFAKLASRPRSSVTVLGGDKSRNKILHFAGLTAEQLEKLLAPHLTR